MWNEPVEKRFFWMKAEEETKRLLHELIKAEQEEDTGIYLLILHYEHACKDLPFEHEESREILYLLDTLIDDSRKHQKLLQDMIAQLERVVAK